LGSFFKVSDVKIYFDQDEIRPFRRNLPSYLFSPEFATIIGALIGGDVITVLPGPAMAHFGHEFRAFTGLTPTRYVEVRRRFLREHPGHVLDSWPLPAD
jgi:hypothetical protein